MSRIESLAIPSQSDGLGLSVCLATPDSGEPKALVQLAHGMAEHKGRYLAFMEFLADHGYAALINDHRGHGGSIRDPGDLGYFYAGGADALVEDLHQLTLWFRAHYPGKKLFLFGHSMGSLAVRVYRQRYDGDIDGMVICGSPGHNPATGVGLAMNRAMTVLKGERYISKMFVNMTTGGFNKDNPKPGKANQDIAHSNEPDPLCGFPYTLNGYRALLTLMRDAYKPVPAGHPAIPVHFLSGEGDRYAPDEKGFNDAVERLHRDGYQTVTAHMYPGMRHELLNHPHHMQVYEDLLALFDGWLS